MDQARVRLETPRPAVDQPGVTRRVNLMHQYLLARKFPALRKTFAYVNFGTTAAATAQYGYNLTNR